MQPATNHAGGFTLIETIIYVGLFGIMFTGIFVSIYPFFTGAERLSQNIATEGETTFILAKLRYALSAGIITSSDNVTEPAEGDIDDDNDTLVIRNGSAELFRFEEDENGFCTPPLTCKTIVYAEDGDDVLPLNATRVHIENFNVKHYAPNLTTGSPRYLEVTFDANGFPVGPVRYYLHF